MCSCSCLTTCQARVISLRGYPHVLGLIRVRPDYGEADVSTSSMSTPVYDLLPEVLAHVHPVQYLEWWRHSSYVIVVLRMYILMYAVYYQSIFLHRYVLDVLFRILVHEWYTYIHVHKQWACSNSTVPCLSNSRLDWEAVLCRGGGKVCDVGCKIPAISRKSKRQQVCVWYVYIHLIQRPSFNAYV